MNVIWRIAPDRYPRGGGRRTRPIFSSMRRESDSSSIGLWCPGASGRYFQGLEQRCGKRMIVTRARSWMRCGYAKMHEQWIDCSRLRTDTTVGWSASRPVRFPVRGSTQRSGPPPGRLHRGRGKATRPFRRTVKKNSVGSMSASANFLVMSEDDTWIGPAAINA